jgi:hypothetical protein
MLALLAKQYNCDANVGEIDNHIEDKSDFLKEHFID